MKFATRIAVLLLALLSLLSFVACGGIRTTGVWASAIHATDKELGEGAKTVTVDITAEGQTLSFVIHTDKETLAEAMQEHRLIQDENGLIHTVNGIKADWNDGGWWWKFTKNGEMMMEGAATTAIANGDHYEFTRTNVFD